MQRIDLSNWVALDMTLSSNILHDCKTMQNLCYRIIFEKHCMHKRFIHFASYAPLNHKKKISVVFTS